MESFVLADVRAELLAALLVVEGGVLQVELLGGSCLTVEAEMGHPSQAAVIPG